VGAAEESEFRSAGASGLIRWTMALWGQLRPKGPFCFQPEQCGSTAKHAGTNGFAVGAQRKTR